MKRIFAALLSLSVVLAMAGCKKEKETTTASTTESTTKEATTSESSEAKESETTASETETSATETTVASVPYEPMPVDLSHDLEILEFNYEPIIRAYGKMISRDGFITYAGPECSFDHFTLTTPGYESLASAMDKMIETQFEGGHAYYENKLSKMDTLEWRNWGFCHTNIVRADEKVCSFALSSDIGDYNNMYYTLDSKTGKALSLYDVVTDRDGFADALLTYIDAFDSDVYDSDDYTMYISDVAEQIRNGEEIAFMLYQNCIFLADGELFTCTVSALDHGDCLDLSYFTSTPEYYTLVPDNKQCIRWDFDGDGVLDVVQLRIKASSEYRRALQTIFYNGTAAFSNQYENDIYYTKAYMMYTDSGFYLYSEGQCESVLYDTSIYHLHDGEIFDTGSLNQFLGFPYNPAKCLTCRYSDMMGNCGYFVRENSIIGNRGVPQQTSPRMYKDGYSKTAVTKMDLNVQPCDADGNETGDKFTLPEGTAVLLKYIDTDRMIAVLSTLNENESKNVFFLYEIATVSTDYLDYDFAEYGQVLNYDNLNDTFDGMLFGD